MYYVVIVLMTIMGAVAAYMLKKTMSGQDNTSVVKNYRFYLGGCLYGASALLNIWVLKYLDYSVVLPMTSLTYVWTLLLGRYLLGEVLSLRKGAGIALIVIGSILVSY